MPKYIPSLTPVHYACMLAPAMAFVMMLVRYREQVVMDMAEEEEHTKKIQNLLIFGSIFAGFVSCCYLHMVPIEYIRFFFPKWQKPAPMPFNMKILVITCFTCFIVYPTMKYVKRRLYRMPTPEVHRLKIFSSSNEKKYGTTHGTM